MISRVCDWLGSILPTDVVGLRLLEGDVAEFADPVGNVMVSLDLGAIVTQPGVTESWAVEVALESLLSTAQDLVVESSAEWWPTRGTGHGGGQALPSVSLGGGHLEVGYRDTTGWVAVLPERSTD